MYSELEELVANVKFSVSFDTVLLYILPEIEDFLPQLPPKEIKVEQDLEIQWEMQEEVLFYEKFAPCLLFGVGKKNAVISAKLDVHKHSSFEE